MVSLTLKVVLHVAENDSKYRDVAPLKKEINSLAVFVLVFVLYNKTKAYQSFVVCMQTRHLDPSIHLLTQCSLCMSF